MMAYCPECGSEVAPNNTFCAYCGIALQPVPAVEDTPLQSEIPAINEPKEEVLPDTPSVNEPILNNQPSSDFQIEPIQLTPIPPTPFILEEGNFSPIDSSSQFPSSVPTAFENTPIENKTGENYSDKTADFSNEIIENELKNESIHSSELNLTESASEAVNNVEPQVSAPVEDLSTRLEIQPDDQFLPQPEEKPFAIEAIEFPVEPKNIVNSENLPPINQVKTEESDINFAETMPYTPADYVSNSLRVDENTESNNEISQDEDKKSTEVFSSEEFIKSLSSENKVNALDSNFDAPSNPLNIPSSPLENNIPTPVDSQNPLVLDDNRGIEIPNTPIPEPPAVTPVFISLLPKEENVADVTEPVREQVIPEVKSEIEAVEERPVTKHNIGVVDTDGNKSAKLKPIEEGTILNGRYEIVRKIGGGGMGAVYLASDRNLGGVLRAVKEMVQSSIEDEQQEKAINDFKRESTILSALEHPAIPTIFDIFLMKKKADSILS